MKRSVFIITLLVCPISLFAQITVKKAAKIELLKDNGKWNKGSIMLADGSEVKGLVKFNSRSGVLFYNENDNARPLTARNILAFEFFDDSIQLQRSFYSIEQEDPQTEELTHIIFEVIRDYKTFAILLKTDPIGVNQKTTTTTTPGIFGPNGMYTPGTSYPSHYGLEATQTETVFILDEKGKARPYFQLTTIEDGTKSLITSEDAKKKNKMIDADLLAEYISEPVYQKLKEYAKEKELRFHKKEDFLKLLDYYDSIQTP